MFGKRFDKTEEEIQVSILFVFKLEEKATALQPDISGFHPLPGSGFDQLRMPFKKFTDKPSRKSIDSVPPGFSSDEVFDHWQVYRR